MCDDFLYHHNVLTHHFLFYHYQSKDGVEVVPAKAAQQIAERDPAAVLVLHDEGKGE
ncbi:MAG: hypothetical protein ACTFAK_06000 [Candidatus Electronema sp. VV]